MQVIYAPGVATPDLTIVIPTRDRPVLLAEAVETALTQDLGGVRVVVVDDASTEPVSLPAHPRLQVVRSGDRLRGAGARNLGTEHACSRWVSYLDDDDLLLPHFARISLEAAAGADLPPPVGVLSGIEVLDGGGQVIQTRLPPTLPRGRLFSLEPPIPGRSFHTKQTLVVERDVLTGIGGWDARFRSRVHTDLFLRLNPTCSLLGVGEVTYRLRRHDGPRVSGDRRLRQESYRRLLAEHRSAFRARRAGFAGFVFDHAVTTYEDGQRARGLATWVRAVGLAPRQSARRSLVMARQRFAGPVSRAQ